MDIVYLLNTKKKSKILPLSIKTAKSHLDYRDIYIVGRKPKDIKAKEIFVQDKGKPFKNAVRKLRAVIEDKRVSEDFILMNDDFLILKEYKEIPYYHRGKIKDFKPNTYWKKKVKKLKKEFPEGNFYEIHFPVVYNKQKLSNTLDRMKIKGGIRTHYCNYNGIEGKYHKDHKVLQEQDLEKHNNAPFLSTTNTVENTSLSKLIKIVNKSIKVEK